MIGIVTDRDVRLAVNSPLTTEEPLERLELLNGYKAEDCMTLNPRTVTPETPIHKVAELLSMYKFGALPVVKDDELVGIITDSDFIAIAINLMEQIEQGEPDELDFEDEDFS